MKDEDLKMKTRICSTLLSFLFLSQVQSAAAQDEGLAELARQRDMSAVEKLLAEGADPNEMGHFSTPALHWVINYSEWDITARMLEAGADPNLRNPTTGITPLSLALAGSDPALVALLLESGADPNAK